MYLKFNDTRVSRLLVDVQPNNRKDIIVQVFKFPIVVNSYWDGGSRDRYTLVHVLTGKSLAFGDSHPYFNKRADGRSVGRLEIVALPENMCLVKTGYYRGKNAHPTIYLSAADYARLNCVTPTLTASEREALECIRGVKSAYRAEEFARHSLGEYSLANPLVCALHVHRLIKINKAGAISVTTLGRNA